MEEMCSNEIPVVSRSSLQYNSTSPITIQSTNICGNNFAKNQPPQPQLPQPHPSPTSVNQSHSPPIQQQSQSSNTSGMSMLAAVPPGLLPLDHYRLQLYNYAMAERLRCSQYSGPLPICPTYPTMTPYGPRLALSMSLFHNRVFQPEEPKPQHSYIGLIAMAILSAPDSKLVLSDIYQHILDNYPYFRTRGPGWRNSIRHNLSLNDCFIKSGRSANGKGHFWAIHPANIDDFKKGDFRRRKAQRKVRKHMGLAVDDEGTDSPSPPPLIMTPPPPNALQTLCPSAWNAATVVGLPPHATIYATQSRKRQFDVASLLAPDEDNSLLKAKRLSMSGRVSDIDEDIDVVASDQEDSKDGGLDGSPIGLLDRADSPNNRYASGNVDDDSHVHPNSAGWHGLMQQWPGGLNVGMDPRILGRYYGQYMAAAQNASRRLNLAASSDLSEIPPTLQSNDC